MDSSRSGLLSTLIMTVPLIVVPAIALLRPAVPSSGVSTTALDAAAESPDDLFSEFDEFGADSLSNAPLAAQKSPDGAGADDYSGWFDNENGPSATGQAALTNGAGRSRDSGLTSDSPGLALADDIGFHSDPFAEAPAPSAPAAPALVPRGAAPPDGSSPPGAAALPGAAAPSAAAAAPGVPQAQASEDSLLRQVTALGATRTLWFTPGQAPQVGFVAFVPGETPQMSYRFEAIGSSRAEALQQVCAQLLKWRAMHPPQTR